MDVLQGNAEIDTQLLSGIESGRKKPAMLEVLQVFNALTPATIKLKQLQFRRPGEAPAAAGTEMERYDIRILGEIMHRNNLAIPMLENYVRQLRRKHFFRSITLRQRNWPGNSLHLQFEMEVTM